MSVLYSVFSLADSIFADEFQYSTGIGPQFYFLSGYLSSNIGKLNTLLYTSFGVEDGNFVPTGYWGHEERAIYKQIYLKDYYNRMSRNALRGIDGSVQGGDFTSLRDGDTVIQKSNKNEVAKSYRSLSNDTQLELNQLVSNYNLYKSSPLQVAGNIFCNPTGC